MKHTLILIVALSLGACSNQIIVRTDYDKEVDIRNYNTFVWLDNHGIEERNNPLYYNELNDKRIKTAVVRSLNAKGYTATEEKPRLKVHYHIVIEDKTQVRNDVYSSYWINSQRDVYRYREGTLIIDLMDADKGALLWRGWAVSALSDSDQMSEELIETAVAKIFNALPVSQPH